MRVAVGGVWHETNTFAAHPTPLEAFEIHEGEALRTQFTGTRTPIGGFLDGAREGGFEIVPTLFASATPSGTVTRPAYEELAGRLMARAAEARPDGILLDLHGAMVVDGCEAVEEDLALRLRGRLGRIPMGCVLDFHANISPSLPGRMDFLCGYRTYPHVDPYDRGVESASLMASMLAGKIRPVAARRQPPLLTVPQAQRTDADPMLGLMARAREAEEDPRVLSVTVAGGFPYADVPHAGVSVVVVADGDAALAGSIAEGIAAAAWAARAGFRIENVAPPEAVARALAAAEGPVLLVDQADNIGGGSPGDGTALLAELLRTRARGAVVSITDPGVVAEARAVGTGGTIETALGGKVDRLHGPPVRVRARVGRLGCGDFTYKGSYMTGRKVQAGGVAVLDADGIRIVVRDRKVMPFDAEELRVAGIEPRECRIIVVKSALAWKAAYGEMARAVIEVDTPGCCTARLETLPYRRLRRPIAPLDPGVRA